MQIRSEWGENPHEKWKVTQDKRSDKIVQSYHNNIPGCVLILQVKILCEVNNNMSTSSALMFIEVSGQWKITVSMVSTTDQCGQWKTTFSITDQWDPMENYVRLVNQWTGTTLTMTCSVSLFTIRVDLNQWSQWKITKPSLHGLKVDRGTTVLSRPKKEEVRFPFQPDFVLGR